VLIRVHPWLFLWNLNCFGKAARNRADQTNIIYGDHQNLEGEIKKLSLQAVQAKMDLHDLSEELPTNWERIPEVTQKTFQIYEMLIAAKQKLAALGG